MARKDKERKPLKNPLELTSKSRSFRPAKKDVEENNKSLESFHSFMEESLGIDIQVPEELTPEQKIVYVQQPVVEQIVEEVIEEVVEEPKTEIEVLADQVADLIAKPEEKVEVTESLEKKVQIIERSIGELRNLTMEVAHGTSVSGLGFTAGGGEVRLQGLDDVSFTESALLNGQSLVWSASEGKWIAATVSGGGGGGAVDSVNGEFGVVVIDADDVDDTTTTNKFATQAELDSISTALQPSDIGVSVQAFDANVVIDANYVATDENFTTADHAKLDGIAAGAEVNVQSDWNATSGDALILNKPTLFSGSYNDLTDQPTLFSGSYTDLTNQPTLFSGSYNDLTDQPTLFSGAYADLTGTPTLFSGSYNDLTDTPTIPPAAPVDSVNTQTGAVVLDADDIDDTTTLHKFATAAQLSAADSAVQPGDLAAVATSGAYGDLTGTPTLFSGSYNDLTDTPTIPTNNNELTNGAGYITGYTVTEGDVTAHQASLTIAQSQVTNLTTDLAAKADLVGGVIPNSQLPSLAISEYLGTVADQTALLALTGQRGDWAIRTDTGSTWVITTDGGSTITDWTELATPADAVTSVNGFTGTVVLGASDVGAATAAQGSTADSAVQPGDLATVATTGAYSDLTGAPTVVSAFTNDAGYITSADGGDAATLDTLDSTQFLRSDTDDTMDGNLTVNGDVTFTDTATDSLAGPEFSLYRNSASPTAGDYLGQIRFDGKNSNGGDQLYAKITGKTSDVTLGSEDGLIEYAVVKAGTQTIVQRLTGSALKLINGTSLEVNGDITTDGTLSAAGIDIDSLPTLP